MKASWFFNNVWKILAFAFIGTFVSSFVVGGFLKLFGMAGASLNLSFAECLSFGALISATDPVTTLAVLEKLKVDPHLFYIIFGESVMNDAVAIVLFHTFEKFIGYSYDSHALLLAIADFVFIFVGSTVIGFVIGCITSLIFKHVRLFDQPLLELSIFILFCYIPFVLGEMCYMSGIVAILFTGLTMKHYTYNNLSEETKHTSSMLVKLLAALAETVVFIDLGTSVWSFSKANAGMIIWAILLCLAARAMHVYPISWLLNERKSICNVKHVRPIKSNEIHMIAFSGLRGAIAYALSVNFPGENGEYVRSCTTVVVMLSVLLLGGATEPVLNLLKIPMGIKRRPRFDVNGLGTPFAHELLDREDGEWQDVDDSDAGGKIDDDEASVRSRSNSDEGSLATDLVPQIQLALSCTCLLNFDRRVLKPFLIRKENLRSPRSMPRRLSHAIVVDSSRKRSSDREGGYSTSTRLVEVNIRDDDDGVGGSKDDEGGNALSSGVGSGMEVEI